MVSEVTCTRFIGPKRRLPKSATRHDPRARLTADTRSSPVPGSVLLRSLCVCRVFRHLAVPETPESRASFRRNVSRRSSESRRPCDLRVPDSPRAKDLHYAGDPPRDLSEHPGSSSTCCHGSLEWFRRWLADQGPHSATVPRRPAASKRPRVLSTVRMPPGLLPTSPSFPRAGPPSRCTR